MKIRRVESVEKNGTHDAGIPSSFEPFENERKSNCPEDVEKQMERAKKEVERRLKKAKENALETKGEDHVGEKVVESIADRRALATFVNDLKNKGVKYSITRSKTEGMRYDVSYIRLNEDAKRHANLDAVLAQFNKKDGSGMSSFEFVAEENNGNLRIYDRNEHYHSEYLDDLNSMMANAADEFGFNFTAVTEDKVYKKIEDALRKDGIVTDDNPLEWESNVVLSVALPGAQVESLKEAVEESFKEHKDDVSGLWINNTVEGFDPQKLVDSVKDRHRNLHNNLIAEDTNDHKTIYFVGVDAMGANEEDALVWIDVVRMDYDRRGGVDGDDIDSYIFDEKQDRVLMKNCGQGPDKWDKAVEYLKQWKEGVLAHE